LAIIDLSEAAAQPMLSGGGRFALSYNGECYNYRTLAERFRTERSQSDTAVVLQALVEEAESALPRFNAMFALAFWDEEQRTLLLARDRYGQKPLYYGEVNGHLCFASELRALLASGLFPRSADPLAVGSFLTFGSVQGPETIIEGVRLLPAGSSMRWSAGRSQPIRSYWTPPRDKIEITPERLREEWTEAVRRHLISDAPIGLFLSGGIDSAAVAGAVGSVDAEGETHAINVSFPDLPSRSEAGAAKEMANRAGVRCVEVPLSATELRSALAPALAAQDQPSIDGLNTWIVSRAARESGLKAALSGLGGDELFAGYPRFRTVPRGIKLRRWVGPLGPLAGRAVERVAGFDLKAGKAADLLRSRTDPLSVYLVMSQLFAEAQCRLLLAPRSRGCFVRAEELRSRALLESLADQRALPDQIGLWEMFAYMGQTLLRDSDAMGMNHGLEIRNPFLDGDFSDTVLMMDPSTRSPEPRSKHRLIDALGDWLPPAHLEMKKQGFDLPLDEWLSGDLRDFAEAGLRQLKQADTLFDAAMVRTVWSKFLESPRRVGVYRPWALVVLGHYLHNNELL
jgi:asparagine synthase (glutamine-hydrolysing)